MGGVSTSGRKSNNALDSRHGLQKYKSPTRTNLDSESFKALNSELVQENSSLFETILPPGEAGLTITKTGAGLTILRTADNSMLNDLNPGDIIIGLDGVDITQFSSKVVMLLLSKRKHRQRTLMYQKGTQRSDKKSIDRRREERPNKGNNQSRPNRRIPTNLKAKDVAEVRAQFQSTHRKVQIKGKTRKKR